MEKLLAYIKPLSRDARAAFFAKCMTTEGYVRKVASVDGRFLGPAICVRVERETSGQVTRRDLRPQDWEEIWPELASEEGGMHLSSSPSIPVASMICGRARNAG